MSWIQSLFTTLLLAVPLAAQDQVWIVDPAGSGDFTTIQPAIDAAAAGDVVVVRSGTYPAFTLGKPLTVTSIEGANARAASFAIVGIAAGEHAIVRGFAVDATVDVAGCAGVVELEELERVYPYDSFAPGPPGAGLRVVDSAAVVLMRSEIFGGSQDAQPATPALELSRSTLHAYASVLLGGKGQDPGSSAGDGGAGAALEDAHLYLADGEVRGGTGAQGFGEVPHCIAPGTGGSGITFVGGPSDVLLLEATVEGGDGGSPGLSSCSGAPDGPQTTGGGALSVLPGDALSLAAPRTKPANVDVPLELSNGPAGALAFVGLGAQPLALDLPGFLGPLWIDAPYDVIALGALDGEGALAATIPAGAVPSGAEAKQLHLQAGYVSPQLDIVLGAPAGVTVSDALPPLKTVWIVDASGGGDFQNLQVAHSSVPPGSTLLVRTGVYDGLTVQKSLTIVADAGADVMIDGTVQVRELMAGQHVTVRGVHGKRITALDCAGSVWFEDVVAFSDTSALPAVNVYGSTHVVLSRVSAKVWPSAGPPYAGLVAENSDVYAYDCAFEGAAGTDATFGTLPAAGKVGGPGVRLFGVRLVASGTTMVGGAGGQGVSDATTCLAPGAGGAALQLQGGASEVWLLDEVLVGGAGGVDASGGICAGAAAPPGATLVDLGTGSSVSSLGPGTALSMTASSPVREGTPVAVQLEGPPDAPAFLALGDGVEELFLPSLAGAIHVGGPYVVASLGALDGNGELTVQIPLPPLSLDLDQKHYLGQAAYLDGLGGIVLGPPSDVLLLGAKY